MRKVTGAVVASLTVVSLMTTPAHAAKPVGWGWGQLQFADLPEWQSDAAVEALVTARVQGRFEARRSALQPLVDERVISNDQADLIATSTSNAIIAALVKSGEITKPQAVLIRKALAGSNGWPAKQAAARIAVQALQDSGLLTAEQAESVRSQALGS